MSSFEGCFCATDISAAKTEVGKQRAMLMIIRYNVESVFAFIICPPLVCAVIG
jgi:hypothetical protein